MFHVRSRLILACALAGLLISISVNVWQAVQWSKEGEQRAQAQRFLVQALQKVRDLESQPAAAPGAVEAPVKPAAPPRRAGRNLAAGDVAAAEAVLLRQELNDAQRRIADLQSSQVALQEAQQTAASDASTRFASAQKEWNEKLDALTQQLESARADAEASRRRVQEAKAVNTRLKDAQADDAARAAETAGLVARLQELNRRRDSYLTSLTRRYRDVSDQFRAMSGMLDSNRGPGASALSESALTRIQSTVSQAEDDLQQLNEVGARIQQLEKRLSASLKTQSASAGTP